LIIEDERGIADSITYPLKTEGFATCWCLTGAEGLKCLEEKEVSLIILDVGLPDINGFELFKIIRKQSSVPLIFLTARSEEIDRILGLELGADDYVTKPFSPRELTARVKAVLRRTNASHTPDARPGKNDTFPLRIDEKKQIIYYFGESIKTSRYEYRIMLTLLKHPGWVYSREQLMENAWDEPDASLVRTVDTHIKNLRHKFKEINPQHNPIITHHGSGYSLKEDW